MQKPNEVVIINMQIAMNSHLYSISKISRLMHDRANEVLLTRLAKETSNIDDAKTALI